MSDKKHAGFRLPLSFQAMLCWLATAALLLPSTALVYTLGELNLSSLGAAGAAIAFVCSLLAGLSVRKCAQDRGLLTAMLTGLLLSAMVLLIAFLAGGWLGWRAILQTTVLIPTGMMIGFLLSGRQKRRPRRRQYRSARRAT